MYAEKKKTTSVMLLCELGIILYASSLKLPFVFWDPWKHVCLENNSDKSSKHFSILLYLILIDKNRQPENTLERL